jgi:hypothetical protein
MARRCGRCCLKRHSSAIGSTEPDNVTNPKKQKKKYVLRYFGPATAVRFQDRLVKMSTHLRFVARDGARSDVRAVDIGRLVIAGWTGRDPEAVQHHIDELKALGVKPPTRVPCFYRCASSLLTQESSIEVLGNDSGGEVEAVLIVLEDGIWVTVGSDHTDRAAEVHSIALAKQLCAKPIGNEMWRLDDLEKRWDRLLLRSFVEVDGVMTAYQAGNLSALIPPSDLLHEYELANGPILPGTVVFCGTLPAIGGVRPSSAFEMCLEDAVSGRRIVHRYKVISLKSR